MDKVSSSGVVGEVLTADLELPPSLHNCWAWQRHPRHPGGHAAEAPVWASPGNTIPYSSLCWSWASAQGRAFRQQCLWPTTPARAGKPREAPCPRLSPHQLQLVGSTAAWVTSLKAWDRIATLCLQISTGCHCRTGAKHYSLALKTRHNWPPALPLPPHAPRFSHSGFLIFPRARQAYSPLCSLQKRSPFPGTASAPSHPPLRV